jgi:hypothetical protein
VGRQAGVFARGAFVDSAAGDELLKGLFGPSLLVEGTEVGYLLTSVWR